MAGSRRDEIDWWDHRYAMVLCFVAFVGVSIHLLAWLVLPPGPTLRTSMDEQGRTVKEYVLSGSSRPFRVAVFEDGSLVEERFDRNENGNFESIHFYRRGILTEQHVSMYDDDVYDVRRIISGNEMLEMYDRNRDGHFEEKRWLRDGLRVREEIDRDGDGNPEQRIVYDERGQLLRLELDDDSDGVVNHVIPPPGLGAGRRP